MRRVPLAVLALALLAGCGVDSTEPATMPSPTSELPVTRPPAWCPAEGVRLAAENVDAAMGVRVLAVSLVNCGFRPYTLTGYPDVRLFDENHEPVDVVVHRGAATIATLPEFDAPPRPLTLRPGEWARTGLLWRNLVTDATVEATTAVGLEIAPSTGRSWQSVRLDEPPVAIDLGNTGELGVMAWKRE